MKVCFSFFFKKPFPDLNETSVGVCGNSEYIPTFHELVLVAKPTWTFGGKAVSCLNFSFDSCQKLGAKKGRENAVFGFSGMKDHR